MLLFDKLFLREDTTLKKLALLISLLLAVMPCAYAAANEITVFNCYDYIDPAVNDLFEEETGIHVNYTNYTTNEEMYTKLENNPGTYDVIFPSDYMVEKLIANDMLETLTPENVSNRANLLSWLQTTDFDPDATYSVPYMWGTLGILYNPELVGFDITSWSSIFDGSIPSSVIMMNSMRDTLGVTLKYLGYSLNTHEEAELTEATQLLIKQKTDGIATGYLLDEVKDKMVGGEAAVGMIYSGDAQYAIEKNENLVYVVPEEGSNVWVDAMCIPKGSQNKEAAEMYIDFMCRPDVAQMNFEYIYYCSPIQQVVDGLDEEEAAMNTINPSAEVINNCEYFHDVTEVMSLYENAWMELRMS